MPKSDLPKPGEAAYSDFLIAQINDRRHQSISKGILYPKLCISSLGKSIVKKRRVSLKFRGSFCSFFTIRVEVERKKLHQIF